MGWDQKKKTPAKKGSGGKDETNTGLDLQKPDINDTLAKVDEALQQEEEQPKGHYVCGCWVPSR